MKKYHKIIFRLLCIFFVSIIIIKAYTIVINKKEVILVGSLICAKVDVDDGDDDDRKKKRTKTSASNIGIITCIDKDTNQFVSFGHSISQNIDEEIVASCYEAEYVDITKPSYLEPGTVEAKVNKNSEFGVVTLNTNKGIYGNITDESNINIDSKNTVKVASRFEVKKGNAKMFLNLDGNGIKEYDIEITGIDYLGDNQNINIKVTDEELLNVAGGIVRGMSGTPIIQNGKLIGVVNYVSNFNSTEAFAEFADKLF